MIPLFPTMPQRLHIVLGWQITAVWNCLYFFTLFCNLAKMIVLTWQSTVVWQTFSRLPCYVFCICLLTQQKNPNAKLGAQLADLHPNTRCSSFQKYTWYLPEQQMFQSSWENHSQLYFAETWQCLLTRNERGGVHVQFGFQCFTVFWRHVNLTAFHMDQLRDIPKPGW